MGDDCPPVPHCYENKTKSKVFSLEMSVQNFRFLARLVVAEKFVVVVGWWGGGGPGQVQGSAEQY